MDRYSLKTGLREQTILKDVYFTPPFNLVEVRENKKNHVLEVMVMSSSPGLLNNDIYDLNIEVIDNSALNLQTQSYQRIHVSEKGTEQRMNVQVGENAYFSHVPHPTVPHVGARYKAVSRINLTNSSTLLWGEILTCGRKDMDGSEVFKFKKHHAITEVYQDDKLIFKDNLYIAPDNIDLDAFGQYENYTHQGSLFFIDPNDTVENRMEELQERFAKEQNIIFGISELSKNSFALRVLGHKGEQLYNLFTQIRKEEDARMNKKASLMINQERWN